MKNYKIIVQYDGTRYKGWQVQKSTDVTIQGKLQMVLSKLAGHPVEVIGSGRTDAGVHASGQVANFHIEEHFSKEQLMEAFWNFLPEDIAVIQIEEVDERFHSRFHAVSKHTVTGYGQVPFPQCLTAGIFISMENHWMSGLWNRQHSC